MPTEQHRAGGDCECEGSLALRWATHLAAEVRVFHHYDVGEVHVEGADCGHTRRGVALNAVVHLEVRVEPTLVVVCGECSAEKSSSSRSVAKEQKKKRREANKSIDEKGSFTRVVLSLLFNHLKKRQKKNRGSSRVCRRGCARVCLEVYTWGSMGLGVQWDPVKWE